MSAKFWTGPYGVRVPMHLDSVVADDGGNTLYRDGSVTEMFVEPEMTKKEYFRVHAEQRADGHWWYKEKQEAFWIGPHEIRVAEHITSVTAEDGGNRLSRDGSQTEKFVRPRMTKDEYFARFVEKRADGCFWWKE